MMLEKLIRVHILTHNVQYNCIMSKNIYSYQDLEKDIMEKVEEIVNQGITMTEPGSINYLLYGSVPSRQATSIKMGTVGEVLIKKIIDHSSKLQLLQCGVHCIDPSTGKKKDLDLLWKNEEKKVIYYREAKGNIDLDSEKLPATVEKINEILNTYIVEKYPDYTIDIGVLNWSIYDRDILKKGLSNIKKCEAKNVKVEHMGDILKLLEFEWTSEQYTHFFRTVGDRFNVMFS